ncbi:4102b9e5-a3b5-4237-83ab-c22fbf43df5a [Sclerotinia trifoliorum]|uniref:4102b9e5-a3b5-4237-83ab-c22fbf43df5a n=1 Tax=Sclerotinia trifoliorum TaxID=28548 RepID=A0A8H2W533_9HELO|nr:4102b9e5-a3b5-4237-83ab-c22fbf43df5a [Sclerotinia trifoliorum]
MGKHLKNRRQSASKSKQQREKSRDKRTPQELTAHSNRSNDETHEHKIIAQPGTGSISREQGFEEVEAVHAESTMVEGRYTEADNESILAQWDFADDNPLFEATEEVFQDTEKRALSTTISPDPLLFDHMGASFPISGYMTATPQTATYSTFPSYNVAHVRNPYQITNTFPITTIHSQQAMTLEDVPITNQFQLSRWLYENRVQEMTFAERLVRRNYDL